MEQRLAVLVELAGRLAVALVVQDLREAPLELPGVKKKVQSMYSAIDASETSRSLRPRKGGAG